MAIEEKRAVSKIALKKINTGYTFLCYAIRDAMHECFVECDHSSFEEFMSLKPIQPYDLFFWFKPDDKESRVQLLETLIDNLE